MKITKQTLQKTRKYAKNIYDKSDYIHNWDNHIEVVVKHAKHIAKKEGMDIDIVEIGALLHDIGRIDVPLDAKDHAAPSAIKAEIFLKTLKLDKDIIESIKDTVLFHSAGMHPKTREALAVYDADKLDHIGPRGMIRDILFDHIDDPKLNIHELMEHASKIAENRINNFKTKTGKQLGIRYIDYTKEFIKGYKEMER